MTTIKASKPARVSQFWLRTNQKFVQKGAEKANQCKLSGCDQVIFMDKTDHQTLVAYAYFNSNNRQVNFNANDSKNENDNARGRASEQVYLL